MTLAARTALVLLVIAALVAAAIVAYVKGGNERTPLTFSPTQVLGATWIDYKANYVEAGSGRTLDRSRQDVTTSEGESYTLLRAVWMGDKTTFDSSWQWTIANLQHTAGDHLFSWLYGQRPDKTYGVLTEQNGNVTASDADQDIALALVFAYARWQDPAYLQAAKTIISDIWNSEIIVIQGLPYLAADNVEKTSAASAAVMNPSYLSPAAYRIFALVDPAHPWGGVVDSSYAVLSQSIDSPLDASSSAGLPPDWITIDRRTGTIGPASSGSSTSRFGFDALRVPWRLALDYQWYGDPRDRTMLSKMRFLSYTWQSASAIGETYGHDGALIDSRQSSALYGGTLGYFQYEDPVKGKAIYQRKLLVLYNPDINRWKQNLSYYDDNWAWFGIGLYNQLLPNLAANVPASFWQ